MTSDNSAPRTFTRRRIVRTTATVAWTVPMIQIAATAPAFAGTGCCDVSLTGSAGWRTDGLNYIDIPVVIANGCGDTVTGLTVTLTICGIDDITYADTTYLPAGWIQNGTGNKHLDADGQGCYSVTFTSTTPLDGNSSTSPVFTVKSKAYVGSGKRPEGTVTAQVTTTGCSSTPVVLEISKVG